MEDIAEEGQTSEVLVGLVRSEVGFVGCDGDQGAIIRWVVMLMAIYNMERRVLWIEQRTLALDKVPWKDSGTMHDDSRPDFYTSPQRHVKMRSYMDVCGSRLHLHSDTKRSHPHKSGLIS